jgi:Putative sensor
MNRGDVRMNVGAYTRRSEGFFSVVADSRSYWRVLYLLLSYPLGLFYFVFLLTGIALGAGLVIIGIGILILALTLTACRKLAAFERELAVRWLGIEIPPAAPEAAPAAGFWQRFKARLADPATWKSLAFLFAKFPFGIFAFVITVILTSLTLGLLTAPLTFRLGSINSGSWPPTAEAALLCSVLGAGLGVVSLHILNGVALLWGVFARWSLGGSHKPGGPVVIP